MTDRVNKRRSRKKRAATPLPKINGRTVKNKSEYDCYNKLREVTPSGTRVGYEVEDIPYYIEGKYKMDFLVEVPKKHGGKEVRIEFKGAGRSWDNKVRQKMIATRDQNPDLDIKIVFYRDATFGAARKDGTKQRQSDWAKRHGFDFCIGVENIPESWFEND